jgi:hypothetical protein
MQALVAHDPRNNLGLVDYLQLMSANRPGETREKEIDAVPARFSICAPCAIECFLAAG